MCQRAPIYILGKSGGVRHQVQKYSCSRVVWKGLCSKTLRELCKSNEECSWTATGDKLELPCFSLGNYASSVYGARTYDSELSLQAVIVFEGTAHTEGISWSFRTASQGYHFSKIGEGPSGRNKWHLSIGELDIHLTSCLYADQGSRTTLVMADTARQLKLMFSESAAVSSFNSTYSWRLAEKLQ